MLTPRQTQVLNFIKDYIKAYNYSPTISEIAENLQVSSRAMIQRILKHLETSNYIKRIPKLQRSDFSNYSIPFLGRIAAGRPIEAINDNITINMSDLLVVKNRFLLEVKGDSMIEDNICDGDWILCEQRNLVNNGEIVVALINQEEATLKRFYLSADSKTVTLKAGNSNILPMIYPAEKVMVQGVYLGLLRLNRILVGQLW